MDPILRVRKNWTFAEIKKFEIEKSLSVTNTGYSIHAHVHENKKDENKEVNKNNDTNQESNVKIRSDKLVYIKA